MLGGLSEGIMGLFLKIIMSIIPVFFAGIIILILAYAINQFYYIYKYKKMGGDYESTNKWYESEKHRKETDS